MMKRYPEFRPPRLLPDWTLPAVVPGAALCVFGGMALLWVCGLHGAYFGLLRFLGLLPFRFPFLDAQAVLSAAQCNRYGFDVYVSNPCDALGRVDVYSPLWLAITPHWLGPAATDWVGALLDLAFLASLALVLRPRSRSDLAIFALAVFSPTTVFALERANNDLLVFLLILYAITVDGEASVRRGCSYLLYLIAGLLKYYPLVLLILLARHRWRSALVYGGVIFLVLIVFVVSFGNQISASVADVPKASCFGSENLAPSYFGYAFTMKNLPFGIACVFRHIIPMTVISGTLLIALLIMTGIRIIANVGSLNAFAITCEGYEIKALSISSILLTACFFAGTNIDYRDIYFLLVIPGLLRFRQSTNDAQLMRWLSSLIAAILVLMWEPFIRRGLAGAVASAAWAARELLWWWLIAALAAIGACYLRRQPLVKEGMTGLRRLRLRLTVR